MQYKKIILALSFTGLLIPGKVLAESVPSFLETFPVASTSEIASPSEIATYSNIEIEPEDENTTVILPGATRAGFIFDHWNTEKDDSGDTYYEGDVIDVNEVNDLYAFWEIDEDYVASPSEIATASEIASPSEVNKEEIFPGYSEDEEVLENEEFKETEGNVEEPSETASETEESISVKAEEGGALSEKVVAEEVDVSELESAKADDALDTDEETKVEETRTEETNTSKKEENIISTVSKKVTVTVEKVKDKIASIFEKGEGGTDENH